jgi:hypothetical protein
MDHPIQRQQSECRIAVRALLADLKQKKKHVYLKWGT